MNRYALRFAGPALVGIAMAMPAAAQDVPAATAAGNPPTTAPTPAPRQADERPNGIAVFAGLYSSDGFSDIVASPWDTKTEDIHLLTPSYSRRIAKIFRIEVESGVGRRFGDNNSVEADAVLGLRWTAFPRNPNLRSTFAVHPVGLSYVADPSPSEGAKDGRSANWLNVFALELTVAEPSLPELEVQ